MDINLSLVVFINQYLFDWKFSLKENQNETQNKLKIIMFIFEQIGINIRKHFVKVKQNSILLVQRSI